MTIHAVCPTVGRWTGGRHATELVLAGELATELGEMGDEVLTHLDHRLFGGDLAVGLDANKKLRHVRVGNFWGAQTCQPKQIDTSTLLPFPQPSQGRRRLTLISSHENVWVLLQMLRDQVSEGVILLLQGEVGAVGHAFDSPVSLLRVGLNRTRLASPTQRLDLRGNGVSVIFFSPSPSKNSSNLVVSSVRLCSS